MGEQHSGTLRGSTPRLIQAQAFLQKQQIMAGMVMMSSYNSFASPMYSLCNVHQFNGQNWETAQSTVVPEMRNSLIDTICKRFNDDGIVCLAPQRKGLSTISATDNNDHNPSTSTAEGFFHGTGISIFQWPTANSGISRDPIHISECEERDLSLPVSYTMLQH